jgi:DHA2 family multidrug resistance protein
MQPSYYGGGPLLLLNIALGLGTFIQVLDTSIANVAIPYIAGSLSVSPNEGTWVITSFAASNAIVLPLTGWLSDYYGRVRLFVYSLVLFAIASFLCGFSTNLTTLVIFRIFQGAVAGSLIPLSQSLLLMHNPVEKHGSVLGFWAMIVVVAPLLGPILGGYISEEYSWPWIFYINIPIGLGAAFVAWHFLKDRDTDIIRNPIDWTGLFLLALGVACLQIMLDKGRDLDWFASNTIIVLTAISVISIAYFSVWNCYTNYPIVDFSFFKDRNFVFGTLTVTIGYLLFFGSTVIIPLWLQTQLGYTAFWAGVAVAPIGLFPVLLSAIVGKNLYRFDLRVIASLSFVAFAIGFFMQAQFTSKVDISYIMFVRLIQGIGITIFFMPLIQLSLGNVPKEKYASAAGLFNFIRILVGSGFGTSLAIELWSRREIFHHSRLADTINLANSQIQRLYEYLGSENIGWSTVKISDYVDLAVAQQAYMLSTNDISWLAGWLFILMIPLAFMCRRVTPNAFPSTASD